MSNTLIVYKHRTNIVTVSLGIDVSDDVITSEIRTASGTLIAEWIVTKETDGSDGELLLRMDDIITSAIVYPNGLMDMKRMTAGEPVAVFEIPIEVEFREVITV